MWKFLKTKWAREESQGAGTPPDDFQRVCRVFSELPPENPLADPQVMPVACTGNYLWRFKPAKMPERRYRGIFAADRENERAILLAVYPRNGDTYNPARMRNLRRRLEQ